MTRGVWWRHTRRSRQRRGLDERPPSAIGPLVLVGLGFLVFVVVLGAWAFLTVNSGPAPQRCEITAAGEEYRQTNVVGEREQLQSGREGDRYSSTSGCVPLDRGLPD